MPGAGIRLLQRVQCWTLFLSVSVKEHVSRRTRLILAISAWSHGCHRLVSAHSLGHSAAIFPAKPVGVMHALRPALDRVRSARQRIQSWWRIAQAFFWCAVVAIPLGLLMGSFRWVHDLVNPVAAPMRSMPITAFLPAFIALFGMEEAMKVAFLWFGMFFYLLAVVVEEVNRVDDSLLETAWTLGAKRRNILWLMFRASFPPSSARSAFCTTSAGPT